VTVEADDKVATRVGAVTLAALAVALALVLILGSQHLRPGLRLTVAIARIGALKVGAPLRLAGLELGRVDDIHLEATPDGPLAILEVWVDRRHAWLVRESTDVFLAQAGLLGETYLEVAPRTGAEGPPLADGARVRAVDPPPIDRLLVVSYQNLEAANALLRDGFPEAKRLGQALDGLEATMGTLVPLGDAASAWASATRLRAEAARFEVGGLDPIDAAGLVASAESARSSLAPRVERLAAWLRRLPPGADARVDRLLARLDTISPMLAEAQRIGATAADLLAYVRGGRGTVGALLQDVELADEIKAMTHTMKREPWRALGREDREDRKRRN
jgi:phospholipid/cholesterol/gamma-HCH transport system substrate-binding protein